MMHFIYGIIKISVILFYKRIFSIRSFVIAANVALTLTIGFILTAFFVSPIEKYRGRVSGTNPIYRPCCSALAV